MNSARTDKLVWLTRHLKNAATFEEAKTDLASALLTIANICPSCEGVGVRSIWDAGTKETDCNECGGSGKVENDE